MPLPPSVPPALTVVSTAGAIEPLAGRAAALPGAGAGAPGPGRPRPVDYVRGAGVRGSARPESERAGAAAAADIDGGSTCPGRAGTGHRHRALRTGANADNAGQIAH